MEKFIIMKKIILSSLFAALAFNFSFGQDVEEEMDAELWQYYADSINKTFEFQTGTVNLGGDLAEINVPEGYKYLDGAQSAVVLHEHWGNPESTTLGLLFKKDDFPLQDYIPYVVEISYEEEGYVSDEDAEDIDYDELLVEMKKSSKEANALRKAKGYAPIDFVGWAEAPYYDAVNKKLHWAKELNFNDEETNTLNYNIRILGRKGYLVLNGIADINELNNFNADKDLILASVNFKEGNQYSDFNPDIDKVAAYGIGGLIAGKVLAKAGFFALILKFWKFIAIGLVAIGAAFKKRFKRKKEETSSTEVVEAIAEEEN